MLDVSGGPSAKLVGVSRRAHEDKIHDGPSENINDQKGGAQLDAIRGGQATDEPCILAR